MNFNKKYKGTVNTNLTLNTNANPLVGITTSFDGVLISANKRIMIGFPTNGIVLGQINDLSGNRSNATSIQGIGYSEQYSGIVSIGTSLPGIGTAFINTGYTTTLQKITVSCWLYNKVQGASSSGRQIFSKNSSNATATTDSPFGFSITQNGRGIVAGIRNGVSYAANYPTGGADLTANNAFASANTWVQAGASYDGSNLQLWANGALVGSISTSTTLPNNTGRSYTIGRVAFESGIPNNETQINADFGVVMVYNRGLSTAEHTQNFNYFAPRFGAGATVATDYVRDGLVIFYDFANPDSAVASYQYFNGIAGTNSGIILPANTIIDLPFDPIRRVGFLSTEASCQVNVILYDEEI